MARQLQIKQLNCPIVITTGVDPDRNDPRLKGIDLKVNYFEPKPFGLESLYRTLMSIHEQPKSLVELLPNGPSQNTHKQPSEEYLPEKNELQQIAEELCNKIKAEAVVLFSMDTISYSAKIVTRADSFGLFKLLVPHIERSPIRDVALDKETVFTNNALAPQFFSKHRFLQQAYYYKSCIGIPVPFNSDSSLSFALFAFHRNEDAFKRADISALEEYAVKFNYLIRINRLEQELRLVKPFEIMGKVYGSMAHDLSAALSLDFMLNKFRDLKNETVNKNDILQELYDKTSHAMDIVGTFRNMARGVQEDICEFPIYVELAEIVNRFSKEAKRFNINSVNLIPHENHPFLIKMRKSGFMQVIYNLLLNAAQQLDKINMLRNGKGEIIIEFNVKTENNIDWAVILIHDNGPGIHKRDFNRVFEMHFTTKKEGCGMGLDICRSIVNGVALNNHQGSLRVLRSILLIGTTFELCLPVRRLSDQ